MLSHVKNDRQRHRGWNGELRFRWQGLGKGRQAPCRAAKVSVQERWSGSGRRGSRAGGGQAERARVSPRWQEEAPEAAQEASQGDGRDEACKQQQEEQLLLLLLLLLSRFSRVQLCATSQTAAHQAPPSLGFSRQERWSGLPFPSPMHESEK